MKHLKSNLVLNALISLLFMFPLFLTNAQTINSSKGRTNGLSLEYNDHNLKSIKKIRDLINEGDYESAANRSITFIRSGEREMRNGYENALKDFNTALENSPDDEAIINVLKQNIGVVKSKLN